MALEPGGYADKLGNRYEGRWVARQLLRVLNEDLRSVTCEAVGDDEQGVDLWVEHLDGVRQDQQCKIRNVSKSEWRIADLYQRGILSTMRRHLDRGPTNQFALVTPLPSILVHDICESARNSSGNPEEFFAYQIRAVGDDRRKCFRRFCERLAFDSESPSDRAQVFSYLQRLFIENWPDTNSSREDLVGQAEMLVCADHDGEPSTVLAVLADFAHDNLRKRLDATAIWKHLESTGFHPRRLSHDARIAPQIQDLQRQFAESISADLIAGELIDRAETQKILESVKHDNVIVLHGSPGQGKSGVLYELTEQFKTHDIAYLPLRLDRKEPQQKTTRQYGAELGLPESPVICLATIAGDRPAVLVLDQLDAIRWTSRHSLGALEVCRELVREIRSLRATGTQASVVLACRTYDMQNDPQIKTWLHSEKHKDGRLVKITVEPLSDETVAKVVTSFGQNPNHMSERQRKTLKSPQHLAMWVRITQELGAFEFQNRVQLMREYRGGRMREMARWGISESDANCALTSVVEYMECNGCISAPRSVIAGTTLLDALCACGLISASDGQITFSHQCYLDFEIASRVVREILVNNQNICDWLGPRDRQSLLRREQLLLALCLLSEESPDVFLETIKIILGSADVRFHLKHLCLEVTGQLDDPPESLFRYIKELVVIDEWREHILGTVFLRQVSFMTLLLDEGTIPQWLERDEWRNAALWILHDMAKVRPDEIVTVLAPYAKRDGEWRQRVLGCLSRHPEDDSDSMFELRLELARQGEFHEYVSWEKLEACRALRLLEAVLSYWEPEDLPQDLFRQTRPRRSRFEHWSDQDLASLVRAVREVPERAWTMLLPQIRRLGPQNNEPTRPLELWLDGDYHRIRQGNECIPHGLVQLAIEAGRCLAKQDSISFWKTTEPLRSDKSPVIRYLLIETYVDLSAEIADQVLGWLMEDTSRLSVGTGNYEPEWKPTARLIETLSCLCGMGLFRQLEETIIHYHAPNERRDAEYCLPAWKNGYYDDYWGRAQHFLLPALCPGRRSEKTIGLIGVLERKYASYGEGRFIRDQGTTFSRVGSTLHSDALDRVSDKAWLVIVRNRSLPADRCDLRRWKDGHWEESSIRMFSQDLEQIAKRFPERFGRLALRFPDDVPSSYTAAILEGLTQVEPKEVSDDEKAAWAPAPVALVEQVLAKFGNTLSGTYASSFCRLLRDRAEDRWSDAALRRLLDYACCHSDPDDGRLCIGSRSGKLDSDEATVENLEDDSLNCVRGIAALAIGQQLWNHPDLLSQFQPAITQVCRDPHPSVRVAAVRMCLPILNLDRDFAIDCFYAASADDLRVAASRGAVYFFNTGMQSHRERLSSLIIEMLKAPQADVVQEGASEVAARWLFHNCFAKELKGCLQGGVPERKGLARTAAHFVAKREYFDKCKWIIEQLKDDEDKEVRESLLPLVRGTDLLQFSEGVKLVRSFVDSKAFFDHPSYLIYGLKQHSGKLLPFSDVLFDICKQFLKPDCDARAGESLGIAHEIVPILVRLHEQAGESKNTQVVSRCLDIWDAMFERRVGVVHELARAIG
jgi:hypothetical protein